MSIWFRNNASDMDEHAHKEDTAGGRDYPEEMADRLLAASSMSISTGIIETGHFSLAPPERVEKKTNDAY